MNRVAVYDGIGCGELQTVLDRLGYTLQKAEAHGLESHPAYEVAKAFHDENTAFWNPNIILFGSHCTAKVTEATARLNALERALLTTSAVLPDLAPPPEASSSDLTELPSTIKWVAGAAIAVSVLFLAGPTIRLVSDLVGTASKRKRLAGYKRSKKRKARR